MRGQLVNMKSSKKYYMAVAEYEDFIADAAGIPER